MPYSSILLKWFIKPCANSLRLWTKNTRYSNFWENFQKIYSENCENACFLYIFEQKSTNHALRFCAFRRKPQVIGKFWDNFQNLSKVFFRKWLKNALFLHIFPISLANHALIFPAFEEKRKLLGNFEKISQVFDEYRKLEFLFYIYFIFYF